LYSIACPLYIVNFVYRLCIAGSGEWTVALLWSGMARGDWCTLNAHTFYLLVWSYCNIELVMMVDWTLLYALIFLFCCCWSFTCQQLEVVYFIHILNICDLWLTGVYISKTSYIRQGEKNLDMCYRPFHVVEYYRYMRFFIDGKLKGMIILYVNFCFLIQNMLFDLLHGCKFLLIYKFRCCFLKILELWFL